jgi:3-isopropylmalate/(R)-2-methylmalate dehydratase small subunit
MQERITGRVLKFGHNVNTDIIIPHKYLSSIDPAELATHVFEVLGEDYPRKTTQFEFVLAGDNFGCGSAREQAAAAIKGAGVKAVIANSYARTFFRNAINSGLPIVECPELYDKLEEGDSLSIDFAKGEIEAKGEQYAFPPLPPSVQEILRVVGLVPYLKGKGLGTRD